MNSSITKTGMVQARIAAFEDTAKGPNLREDHIPTPSGKVSKMISFFETKKAGKRSVKFSSPQQSTKVEKLASIFGPIVGHEDNEKAATNNFPTTKGTSEVRSGDLNAQFSLVTNNSAQPLSPQCEVGANLDNIPKTKDDVEIVHNKRSTKLLVSKRDVKSRTQEFGMKEGAVDATSLGMELKRDKSMSFHRQKSEMKALKDISAEKSTAPLMNGACKPNDASIGVMESREVDVIQPHADKNSQRVGRSGGKTRNASKKIQGSEGRSKSRKVKARGDTKTRASHETTPTTEAKPGRKKTPRRARRSGTERNSRIRTMLMRGVRALKRKLSRETVDTEAHETRHGESQRMGYTITVESASPIIVSCKKHQCL